MRYNKTFTFLLTALLALPLYAQKRKPAVKKKQPAVEVVAEPVDPKLEAMLASTQRVVFIDSVVVDKQSFLDAYLLNPEVGTIMTYHKFFHNDAEPYSTVYMNQLGNKCFYAQNKQLFTSDMIGQQWSNPTPLDGLGDFETMNYPFMLSDGTTFYFAAIGDEGIGGLDIYMSRYDSENGTFLKAENIGMPFNSEANDYMYVVNEMDSIGYFATDRRQPEGMVCIYTFIPNQTRRVYASEDFSNQAIRDRAAITRIADTWGNGSARKRALARIEQLRNSSQQQASKKKDAFRFVVDDNHVYTALSDFRNPDNRTRFTQLQEMKLKCDKMARELEKARNYFAKAPQDDRSALRSEILDDEQEYEQMQTSIIQMEKLIRRTELQP